MIGEPRRIGSLSGIIRALSIVFLGAAILVVPWHVRLASAQFHGDAAMAASVAPASHHAAAAGDAVAALSSESDGAAQGTQIPCDDNCPACVTVVAGAERGRARMEPRIDRQHIAWLPPGRAPDEISEPPRAIA